MSANEQFFVGAPTVIRCYKQLKLYRSLFYAAILLTPAQIKPKLFESTRNSLLLFFFFFLLFFTRGGCPSHVYVRAWALGCFHSLISTQTFSEGADRVGGQLRGDKECPFSGVNKSGRVWRKVPESDWSVILVVTV